MGAGSRGEVACVETIRAMRWQQKEEFRAAITHKSGAVLVRLFPCNFHVCLESVRAAGSLQKTGGVAVRN